MTDFIRHRIRFLRCPADDDGLAPGSPPPSAAEDYDLGQTQIAQGMNPPQNCPPGTAPTATAVTGSISATVGAISAQASASYTNATCAPLGGAPAQNPGAAPASGGGAPSLPNPGIPGFEAPMSRDSGGE